MVVVVLDPLEGAATLTEAAAGRELVDSEIVGAGENDELCVVATRMELALTVTFSCLYETPVARNDGP